MGPEIDLVVDQFRDRFKTMDTSRYIVMDETGLYEGQFFFFGCLLNSSWFSYFLFR